MRTPGTPPKRDWRWRRSFRSCAAICRPRSREFRAPIGRSRNRRIAPERAPVLIQREDADFQALMTKITRDRGFQCSSYKDKCLRRRIAVRMRAKGTVTHTEYAEVLDADPREYDRLMR